MSIEGKNVLVLGAGGMVGQAVCRQLLPYRPARLAVASRHASKAQLVVENMDKAFPNAPTCMLPVCGDVFIRAEWQEDGATARSTVLVDSEKRQRLIADILDPLNENIINSSLLTQMIIGTAPGLDGTPSQIVIDCMNTATAVSYQNLYATAKRLAGLAKTNAAETDWAKEVETLLTSLYVPQLVRHVQLLYEAMHRAETDAYIKVGTSGTGGMGFNIPYTHGEEKPSRLLLSKAAVAGAQTSLTFLLARTPHAPPIVKEVKPAALIGWKKIDYGPIQEGGRDFMLYDCSIDKAVSINEAANLVADGDFGEKTGQVLQGVFIDTGENGKFTAAEFAAITTPGQMQLVTPEEVASAVIRELLGGNTGQDVVAALDSSVMGPTYRGGYLRQAALSCLRQLEEKHGESVAFELLGPPRLSKLLYEAHLLKRLGGTTTAILDNTPEALATDLEKLIAEDITTRQRIISIGIPILLPDGEHLLRGPVIKSEEAKHGWVDLTPSNMRTWQKRMRAIEDHIMTELADDSSSRPDRIFTISPRWHTEKELPPIGEMIAWILIHEDNGARGKP